MNEKDYYLEYLKKTARFPQSIYHRAKNLLVRQTVSALPPGARLLDAGCGIGHITAPYAEKYSVFGLDEQQSAVDCCQKGGPGTFLRGDLYRIPFADNYFDGILFLDVIEHLDRPTLALKELARVLKPEAPILICTMNYSSLLWFLAGHSWHLFFGGSCQPYSKNVHPTRYTEKLLRQHCAKFFREDFLIKKDLNMELFYLGRKLTPGHV